MKVVIIHTDFRIYWPARIKMLDKILRSHRITLDVMEIAGAGSPYAFANQDRPDGLSWHILFPNRKMEDLTSNEINRAVLGMLDQLHPDVIVAGAIAFPSGALAVRWAQKNRKRVIIFDDAKQEDVPRNCIINFIKRSIYNRVDAMLYPSEDWKTTGMFWGMTEERLFYGLDVVDNTFWSQRQEKNQELPQPYLLCVGRQISVKNYMFVLKCYNRYLKSTTHKAPFKLLFVGDGEGHREMVQYVEEWGLSQNVRFMPFVQQDALREIYQQAAAFIMASKKETWGLVINEAMACGLPIMASTDCGATQSLVEDGVNGYQFSANNEDTLLESILKFETLSEIEKIGMGKESLKRIGHWGLDRFASTLLNAIRSVSCQPPRKVNALERMIINLWNGRYRPI